MGTKKATREKHTYGTSRRRSRRRVATNQPRSARPRCVEKPRREQEARHCEAGHAVQPDVGGRRLVHEDGWKAVDQDHRHDRHGLDPVRVRGGARARVRESKPPATPKHPPRASRVRKLPILRASSRRRTLHQMALSRRPRVKGGTARLGRAAWRLPVPAACDCEARQSEQQQ